jgi:hypothetical protein
MQSTACKIRIDAKEGPELAPGCAGPARQPPALPLQPPGRVGQAVPGRGLAQLPVQEGRRLTGDRTQQPGQVGGRAGAVLYRWRSGLFEWGRIERSKLNFSAELLMIKVAQGGHRVPHDIYSVNSSFSLFNLCFGSGFF